jgi:hypothetical protein
MRFEAALPKGKGINTYLYAVLAVVLWITVIDIARRALNMIRVQGTDEVTQSYSEYVHKVGHGEA